MTALIGRRFGAPGESATIHRVSNAIATEDDVINRADGAITSADGAITSAARAVVRPGGAVVFTCCWRLLSGWKGAAAAG